MNTLICFRHLILLFHGVLFAMKLKMFIFAHLIHTGWAKSRYAVYSIYTVSEKDCTLFFFIFFSRCPVCGEWHKLH